MKYLSVRCNSLEHCNAIHSTKPNELVRAQSGVHRSQLHLLLRLTYFWRWNKGCWSAAGGKGQFQLWVCFCQFQRCRYNRCRCNSVASLPSCLQTHSQQYSVKMAHRPHCMPPCLLLSCSQELLLIQTFGLTQCTSIVCLEKRCEMPGSPMQFLSVGFSEHDPLAIKGKREEDNCCTADDVLEGR